MFKRLRYNYNKAYNDNLTIESIIKQLIER